MATSLLNDLEAIHKIFPNRVKELNDKLLYAKMYKTRIVDNDMSIPESSNKSDAILNSIIHASFDLMQHHDIKAEKIIMPAKTYYDMMSSYSFLKYGAIKFDSNINKTIPNIFGMDVEVGGDKFLVKSNDRFNKIVNITDTWKRLILKNGLIIHVKTRAEPLFNCSVQEIKAMDTLREMITETEFRKFLKYGFIFVHGQQGNYQIFRNRSHIKVWKNGKVIEEICVRIKDKNIPLTDNLIAFKTMIETDEDEFRKFGNVYKMQKAA